VLDQELQKTIALRESSARQARLTAGLSDGDRQDLHEFDDKENAAASKQEKSAPHLPSVKRDFFGRVIQQRARPLQEVDGNAGSRKQRQGGVGHSEKEAKVWVTFNEGLNNAVKKPISLEEFLRGL
jgi:chromosome transmission fidelity protein 18